MTLVRWRPSRDLLNINSDFDRLVSDFFGNSLGRRYNGSERTIYPSIDLSESDKEFVVKAELPGVDKDNVKISLQENILTLHGEKNQEIEEKNENYRLNERVYGVFERSIRLPNSVDAKKIKAKFKDGILSINLPKSAEAKLKEIPISVN
ncbi:Hsp20/alpha crystallin family protein [candidate division KSB1 bacterium]|nr:Hsp20/alpha crystallin family protein [candidate division KSB1 bacterium]